MSKNVYLISGTMGSGKDAVLKRLRDRFDFYWIISTTTRPMRRRKEEEGKPYYFVDKKKFNEMINKDKFVEYSKIYDYFYGVTKKEINQAKKSKKKIFLRVNEDGVRKFKKIFPNSTAIFISPPSMRVLRQRIAGKRGKQEDVVARLKAAKRQMRKLVTSGCDYITINSDIDIAIKRIIRIVR